MHKWLLQLLSFCLASAMFGADTAPAGSGAKTAGGEPANANPASTSTPAIERTKATRIYVIPVQEQIGSAVLYIVRRGLKEAIEQKADAVILDMKTPGGSLGTTLEIMEAIAKFQGT